MMASYVHTYIIVVMYVYIKHKVVIVATTD